MAGDGSDAAARSSRRRRETIANEGLSELVDSDLELHDLLGGGSYGSVYVATWVGDRLREIEYGDKVAVKVPSSGTTGGDDADLLNNAGEARILAGISHRNVVQFHGIWVRQMRGGRRLCLVRRPKPRSTCSAGKQTKRRGAMRAGRLPK